MFPVPLIARADQTILAVGRFRKHRFELVRYIDDHESRVIFSSPVRLQKGSTWRATNTNALAAIPFSFVVDPNGTAIAILLPTDFSGSTKFGEVPLIAATMVVVSATGGVVSRTKLHYRPEQAEVIGWEGNHPVLTSLPNGKNSWVWRGGAWKRVPEAELPAGIANVEHMADGGRVWTQSPSWRNLSPYDLLAAGQDRFITYGASRDQMVSFDLRSLNATWSMREPTQIEFARGMSLRGLVLGSYPEIIGIRSGELRAEFKNYDVLPNAPFLESRVYRINALTGVNSLIGEGVRAVVLRN